MGCWRYTYIKKSFIIKDNLGSGTDFPVFCWKKMPPQQQEEPEIP
jgi:hypothetical protein